MSLNSVHNFWNYPVCMHTDSCHSVVGDTYSFCPHVAFLFYAIELQICRWNFSVGQHDVSFVSRKSAGYDSAPHSQHYDRIAARSSHDVDHSCTKSAADSVKYQDTLDVDQQDEYTDQCEIHSQFFLVVLFLCVKDP